MKKLILMGVALLSLAFGGTKALAQAPPDTVPETAPATSITPQEARELWDAPDQNAALNSLMARMSAPEKSIVVVTKSGGAVCPVNWHQFRGNFLLIKVASGGTGGEPSQVCREWVRILQEDSILEAIQEYSAAGDTADRNAIISMLLRWMATHRYQMSDAHFDVVMIRTRASAPAVPQAPLNLMPPGKTRELTPQQMQTLLAANSANDQASWSALMQTLGLPMNSTVFVNDQGGVVCPSETKEFHLSLLIIRIDSGNVSREISDECATIVRVLQYKSDFARIDRYLSLLGRDDGDEIKRSLVQWIAAHRYGISPRALDQLLIERGAQTASPAERLQVIELHQLEIRQETAARQEAERQEQWRLDR